VLAGHAALVQPGHVVVAAKLTGAVRAEAAKRFLTAVRKDEEFPLSAELIDLVASLPPDEFRPVLRARWSELAMREAIVRRLADRPETVDRSRFLDVLETAPADVMRASLSALAALPRDDSPAHLLPLLLRLRQSLAEPKEGRLRTEIVSLINRQAGQGLIILESKTEAASLAKAYQPVFEWFEQAHPVEAKRLNAGSENEATIRAMLPAVKWDAGDVERGRKLFRDRGCLACHGVSARIGPDLAGVSKRFSRNDLLTAIVNPSRDVAPAYRVSNVDLKDGKRLSGIVVFESADGLIVQTGAAETRRIANDDIESRTPSPKSLMPDGLLKGIKPEELADLFAFLAKQ
jgi:putative heme-binding domain-containing protein